jgi:cytochrome P450
MAVEPDRGDELPAASSLSEAPGPTRGQLLRSVRRMLTRPLDYLGESRDAYGPLAAFMVADPPVVLLNDPTDVHRVLVANHRAYTKRTVQYDTLASVTGDGLLVSDPPLWTQRRRMLQPGFHRDALADVAAATVQAARDEADRLVPDTGTRRVDLDEAMMRAALQVVGAALFSTDLSGHAATLVPAVLTALDRVVVRARSPWLPPPAVPTPGNLRLRHALRTIDTAVAQMVEDRRGVQREGSDVLDLLLAGVERGEAGGEPGEAGLRAVRDEMVTLLIAGHETVASALTWAWHLLVGAPAAYDRLVAEVDEVLGSRPAELADLASLPWTRAVVDEALRLYPPAWILTRRVATQDVLAGYQVPVGSLVLISTYALHRDPALWPDADQFRPERWCSGASDPVPRWAYVPFGAGPRQCIGKDFALVEATLMLATLVQRLTVRRPTGSADPHVEALVTLRPRGGLWLEVDRRDET